MVRARNFGAARTTVSAKPEPARPEQGKSSRLDRDAPFLAKPLLNPPVTRPLFSMNRGEAVLSTAPARAPAPGVAECTYEKFRRKRRRAIEKR